MSLVFVSSFITWFQSHVAGLLKKNLVKCSILEIRDWLIFYRTSSRIKDVVKIPYLNNTFLLLYESKYKNNTIVNFTKEVDINMSKWILSLWHVGWKVSYRVKWFIENEPSKLPPKPIKNIELSISKKYRNFVLDVHKPDYEIRISLRKDEKWLCLFRLTKKNAHKWLEKWELRSEFAYLISSFINFNYNDTIIDPFAWYWAIPRIIAQYFPYRELVINDIDKNLVNHCKSTIFPHNKDSKITFICQNALNLSMLESESVNHIVTDPPRWFFENLIPSVDLFYAWFIKEMNRILKKWWTMTVCTAQKELTKNLLIENWFIITREILTLVSRNKVSVYFVNKNEWFIQ